METAAQHTPTSSHTSPSQPTETPAAAAELVGLVRQLATQVGQLTAQVSNQAPLNKPQGSIISWGSSSVQSEDTEELGDVNLPEAYDSLFPTQEAAHRQVPRYRTAWREACKGFTALCNATRLMQHDELIGAPSLLLAAAQHVERQVEGSRRPTDPPVEVPSQEVRQVFHRLGNPATGSTQVEQDPHTPEGWGVIPKSVWNSLEMGPQELFGNPYHHILIKFGEEPYTWLMGWEYPDPKGLGDYWTRQHRYWQGKLEPGRVEETKWGYAVEGRRYLELAMKDGEDMVGRRALDRGYTHPYRLQAWWSSRFYYDMADAEQWPLPCTPVWGYVECSTKTWLEENQGGL